MSNAYAAPADVCLPDAQCAKANDEAAKLAGQTQYEQALAVLEPAYERFHEPRLLVNIGRCHFRLGRARKALAAYQTLQQQIPDPEPELAERLKLYISEAREAIAASVADKSVPLQDPAVASPTPTPSTASTPAPPTPAQTDEPPPAPPVDKCLPDPACQQMSDQGAKLASKTLYDQALALYLRAYERSQEPRLLVNIGRCYFRLGRATKALESFYQLRRTMPGMEKEIATQLEPFIAEAKTAVDTDGKAVLLDEPKAVVAAPPPEKTERLIFGRPAWRFGMGAGIFGLGAVLMGAGGGALAKNGSCVTPSMTAADLCAVTVREDGQRTTLIVDGFTPGVSLLVVGGAVAVAGIVVMALPHRSTKTARRFPLGVGHTMLAY